MALFFPPNIQFSSEDVSSPCNIIFIEWGQSAEVVTVKSAQHTFILVSSLPSINGGRLDL